VKPACCAGRRSSTMARVAASLGPGALLLLVPKCPLCVAAWLTAGSGFTVSMQAAGYVRGIAAAVSMAAACVAVIAVVRACSSSMRREWHGPDG